jgi:hypothetical protein
MGLSEDPVLIVMSAYLKTSTSEAAGVHHLENPGT